MGKIYGTVRLQGNNAIKFIVSWYPGQQLFVKEHYIPEED